jgi:hypothetical protein
MKTMKYELIKILWIYLESMISNFVYKHPNFWKDTFGLNYMSKDALFHLEEQHQVAITTIHIINSQT